MLGLENRSAFVELMVCRLTVRLIHRSRTVLGHRECGGCRHFWSEPAESRLVGTATALWIKKMDRVYRMHMMEKPEDDLEHFALTLAITRVTIYLSIM